MKSVAESNEKLLKKNQIQTQCRLESAKSGFVGGAVVGLVFCFCSFGCHQSFLHGICLETIELITDRQTLGAHRA